MHLESHQKTSREKKRRYRRTNGRGNHEHSTASTNYDRMPASSRLREKTDNCAAADRPDGEDDCDHRFFTHAEAALSFEECRIKILCAARHGIKCRHKENGMNKACAVPLDESGNLQGYAVSFQALRLPN